MIGGGVLPAVALEAHISTCASCQAELARLRAIVNSFAERSIEALVPSESLRGRLAQRIAAETGAERYIPERSEWSEPQWEEVAPGIFCKLLATDRERDRVSMLVRLAPGVEYPAHRHAGVEELHLLDGELWIDYFFDRLAWLSAMGSALPLRCSCLKCARWHRTSTR